MPLKGRTEERMHEGKGQHALQRRKEGREAKFKDCNLHAQGGTRLSKAGRITDTA